MHRELNEEKQQKEGQFQVEGKRSYHSRSETDEKIERKQQQEGEKQEEGEKEQGMKKKEAGNHLEVDDFLADIISDKSKNQKQGQSQLFERTESFYQDQQPANEPKIPQPRLAAQPQPQPNQPQTQQQPKNKYIRCLQSAQSYLQILRIGYYLHLFRFLFILFIYYNMSFRTFEPSSNVKEMDHTANATANGNGNANASAAAGDGKENRDFFPWNAMIYFLSGSIDFISIIGYISSIKLLRVDMKILETRRIAEDQRLLREQQDRERIRNRSSMQEQQLEPLPAIEPEPNPFNQPQNQRSTRIGRQSTYLSVYSTLRQYKHKNRDQAAPFKISKIMHIFATFLFFGRMALIELYQFQLTAGVKIEDAMREVFLWVFMLTAYAAAFQIDYLVMEGSTGPFVRIRRFHFGKILQVYRMFWDWRKSYEIFVKVGVVVGALVLIAQILYHIMYSLPLPSVIFFLLLTAILTNILLVVLNRRLLSRSSSFLQPFHQTLSQVKPSNSMNPSLSPDEPSNCNSNPNDVKKMIEYKNLSLLGIQARHAGRWDRAAGVANRVGLFLFGVALLRESGSIDVRPVWYAGYAIAFGLFVLAEVRKFRGFMMAKINLLDSCKYKQLSTSPNNPQSTNNPLNPNPNPNPNPSSNIEPQNPQEHPSSCSICLLQYSEQQPVIAICCGHIFHEQCLVDWLKQKKECPLCRLNIEEYYQEVSF